MFLQSLGIYLSFKAHPAFFFNRLPLPWALDRIPALESGGAFSIVFPTTLSILWVSTRPAHYSFAAALPVAVEDYMSSRSPDAGM